jgi:glycogen(starch) synthase
MRVLFWSKVFWPKIGGVEVHAARLLEALQARGHEFLVVTTRSDPDQPEGDEYRGIPIHRFPFWSTESYTEIDTLMRIRQRVAVLKRAFAPDLVHVNAVDVGNFFHLLTSQVDTAPLLVTLHGEWESRYDGVVKNILGAADWVAGCSQAILETGRRLAPEIVPRSAVIYNGLEAPPLEPAPLPFEAPRLLCLGRLSPEKGFDLALTAFAAVVRQFPQARLAVAGDGSSRPELEQQAAQLEIGHQVDFLGWVEPEDVPALINTATLVVMPSRQESLPLVALEAALMGRPLVATRVGGLPEVVAHEQTGLLVNTEDSQALADAVELLLRRPAMAIQMGLNARSRAQQLFSWQRHVDGYDALYKKFKTSPSTGPSQTTHANQRE